MRAQKIVCCSLGHSKDDPTLRQVKVMVAALDPLGLPLVTEVVAGNQAMTRSMCRRWIGCCRLLTASACCLSVTAK